MLTVERSPLRGGTRSHDPRDIWREREACLRAINGDAWTKNPVESGLSGSLGDVLLNILIKPE